MPKVEKTDTDNKPVTITKLKEVSMTTSVEDLLESGALPPGINSKEKFLTIAQYGRELGLDPMTAVNSITLISGRMVIASSILGALIKKRGYEYIWSANWVMDQEKETVYSEITIFWYSKELKREMSNSFRMTWAELEQAGLTTRDTYKKYPKQMLRARTLSAAVRAICPEVLMNMYTAEELADRNPELDLDVNEEVDVKLKTENIQDVKFEEVKETNKQSKTTK